MQLLSFSADLPLKTSFFEGLIFSTIFMDFFMLKKPFSKYLNLLKRSKLSCKICSVFTFEIYQNSVFENHFCAFEIFFIDFYGNFHGEGSPSHLWLSR